MSRAKSRTHLNADDLLLMSYGINETTDGFVLFLVGPGRDVHLTSYTRDGRMNAHITDTSKSPQKIWEMEMDLNEVTEKVMRSIQKAVGRYNWNEKYSVLDEGLITALGVPIKVDVPVPAHLNLLNPIRYLSAEGKDEAVLRRIPLREGLENGLLGFQFSKTQTYGVAPIDKNHCVRINSNWKRNYIRFIPTFVGVIRFADYVEAEKLIDWKTIATDARLIEKLQRITAKQASAHKSGP